MKDKLLKKIENKEAHLVVVGMGYVGLPLAVEFTRAGFKVTGLEVDQEKVDLLNSGKSYIPDISSDRLAPLVAQGSLSATTDADILAKADAVSISVPTPLDESGDPDLEAVDAVAREIEKRVHPGMLVVLESTSYPGTTEELLLPRIETSGLKVGEDVFLAFSAERVDPANPKYNTSNTPKVMGGMTDACLELVVALYKNAVDQVVPVSSPRTAEMVKLLENTFRSVNIALANEMAIMCRRLGIDVWEVIEAASTKPFGFMPHYPGPGVGGHCIPIDPHYLEWKLKTLNYQPRIIRVASDINRHMPDYVVERVMDSLNEEGKALRGSKVLVLGVAYKRNIDDLRESPALDVIRLLREKGAQVSFHDPYISELGMDGEILNSVDLMSSLPESDCVVVVTDHSCFDWSEIVDRCSLVVDTRNVVPDGGGKARVTGL